MCSQHSNTLHIVSQSLSVIWNVRAPARGLANTSLTPCVCLPKSGCVRLRLHPPELLRSTPNGCSPHQSIMFTPTPDFVVRALKSPGRLPDPPPTASLERGKLIDLQAGYHACYPTTLQSNPFLSVLLWHTSPPDPSSDLDVDSRVAVYE